MFKWAVEDDAIDFVQTDPTLEVSVRKYVVKSHHAWTIEEVEQYETRHPTGTQARLMLDLLLYTASRREDAPRFGPQYIVKVRTADEHGKEKMVDRLRFTQAKNEDRADIDIPVHPLLTDSIKATPLTGHKTFLVTQYGNAFATNGFGNKFKDSLVRLLPRHQLRTIHPPWRPRQRAD